MPSQLQYIPLQCWNCGTKHTSTQESCATCHGWVLPTRKKQPRESIDWKVVMITSNDSDDFKNEQFKQAEAAIRSGRYTAILGAESPGSPYNLYRTEKTAVFLHRPEDEERLSFTKMDWGKKLASSRTGACISSSDWEIFVGIVGVPTKLLPASFPKPEHLLEEVELDTGGGRLDKVVYGRGG
ncbi:hypothetical protein OCU04_002694 [Sclerotinia nivalis]|uniref:Uncharacterized protein n=1 Tax=Sclerotinia nivalis TaxID=352851 RepID=A0A9X0DQG3_9HELO|nr:hypothetical protein OCU04_002694 [Sclerotinia nivalis]